MTESPVKLAQGILRQLAGVVAWLLTVGPMGRCGEAPDSFAAENGRKDCRAEGPDCEKRA